MKTVRCGVFETNSSSCHCMTILSKHQHDNFDRSKYVIGEGHYSDGGQVYTLEDVDLVLLEFIKEYPDYKVVSLEDLKTISNSIVCKNKKLSDEWVAEFNKKYENVKLGYLIDSLHSEANYWRYVEFCDAAFDNNWVKPVEVTVGGQQLYIYSYEGEQ